MRRSRTIVSWVVVALILTLTSRMGLCAVAGIEEILGSRASSWQISTLYGPDNSQLDQLDNAAVLRINSSALRLLRTQPLAVNSEVTVKFRFRPSTKAAWLQFQAALPGTADQADNPFYLCVQTSPSGVSGDGVYLTLGRENGQARNWVTWCRNRFLPANRITWPALARRRIEADHASLPPLSEHWYTMRYVYRPDSVRVYLDGRLLRENRGENLNAEGRFFVMGSDGIDLAPLRIRALAPADPRFETVPLEHYLNASQFGEDAVVAGSLPEAGQTVCVKGVPFLFPGADRQGRDHVDVGRSWMRFGLLENCGAFSSSGLGDAADIGRWDGALGGDPSRIAFRVPSRPYTHLYLLAASSGAPDTVPVVTAQFYRPQAGFPVNFSQRVPLFTARSSSEKSLAVRLKSGNEGRLHLVDISLEPEGLDSLSDLPYLEVELTKEVEVFRAYPDPHNYSEHGAGLPSGVQVYAMTFEQPRVSADLQPGKFAHIWTAPESPWYSVSLRNDSDSPSKEALTLSTVSYDEQEETSKEQKVIVPAHDSLTVRLPVSVKKYGWHKVQLQIRDADGVRTRTRSLAYLHPDTRERGDWEEGRGPIFGNWNWGGGHRTPSGLPLLEVMTAAGTESAMHSFYYGGYSEAELQYAETRGMMTFFRAYQLRMNQPFLGMPYDPSKPAEMEKAVIEAITKAPQSKASRINRPELAVFFSEPTIGPISYGALPEYYGDPPYQMSASEQDNYKNYMGEFVIAARAIKRQWPGTKCLMPWGSVLFQVPFLREGKEAAALMDGPAIDIVLFERMPEMQMDQVTYAEMMWQWKQEWLKTGRPVPPSATVEGPCVAPATAGALTVKQEADISDRAQLMLMPYGTTRILGWPVAFRCGDYWGETHYGTGLCQQLPLLTPKPVYASHATLTRQLNRMNFVKMVETGSATVFCFQFKHYRTGELLHVFWTLRGTRPVTLSVPPDAALTVYDQMDNGTPLRVRRGQAVFTIGSSPCYVHGLKEDAQVFLGLPDHSDSNPSSIATLLGNPGNGLWKVSAERDMDYENSHAEFIKRFPGRMSVQTVAAPREQGRYALSVHLEPQDKERFVMPYYTTLVPQQPVAIPGRASHLGLWAQAASDWGRVVYCLRDANGARWISVGKKDEWNNDDTYCWSRFCYDGWRYLRFELPGNAPYDCFRAAGSTWWGYYGSDGIVALPLTLEKIIVERRTHVIQGDALKPASQDDVLLADLYAEYAKPADKTEEAVRISTVRMPSQGEPDLDNPIRTMKGSGVGEAAILTRVAPPDSQCDGTRCLVYFDPVPDAKSYDIWVSPYEDGRGAMCLGRNWTAPGQLLTGLNANTALYLFVTCVRNDGSVAPPSAPLRILLKDQFPFK